jgi:RNA polymerase sigma factor (sigma-70 family)
MMTKDLRIEFKFKNAVLLKRLRERFGEDVSLRSMAEAMGVAYSLLITFLSLYSSPFNINPGRNTVEINGIFYKQNAMRIADYLLCADPAEIFPMSLYSLRLPKKYFRDFESVQLLSFQEAAEQKLLPPVESYEENYEALGLKERMNQLLATLTAREEKVIRMRFGLDGEVEHTLVEVGEAFKVSTMRIRQIEKKALKRLRHRARSQHVKVFYTGD